MKRVLVITDSVGLPRPWDNIPYEDTYLHALEKSGDISMWVASEGGFPIVKMNNNILHLTRYLSDKMFDFGILQLGIIDCAPRPIPNRARKVIANFPTPIRNRTVNFLHKHRAFIQKNLWSFQITPVKKFRKEFDRMLGNMDRLCNHVFIIMIIPGKPSIEEHSPGLIEATQRYNQEIETISRKYRNTTLIDVYEQLSADPGKYLTDDLHITKEAHKLIWDELYESMVQTEKNQQPSQS